MTVARPNNLYVFDAAARELVKDCPLEADHPTPGIIAMSPDGRIAYMLVNRWQDVIGVDIDSCATVFRAVQSEGDVHRRSIGSLAVSKDGTRLYTVRNPVRHHVDRYEVLEPEFAVFDTAAGLEAKPLAIHPAPRRSSIMATDREGRVYIAGHDIFAVDPDTGEIHRRHRQPRAGTGRPTRRPTCSPSGRSAARTTSSCCSTPPRSSPTRARPRWPISSGATPSVNLTTGDTEIDDFASFEVIMFSAVRNPSAPNELYGVYTQLSKHDVETNELIKRVDLPHTYYCINISTDGSRDLRRRHQRRHRRLRQRDAGAHRRDARALGRRHGRRDDPDRAGRMTPGRARRSAAASAAARASAGAGWLGAGRPWLAGLLRPRRGRIAALVALGLARRRRRAGAALPDQARHRPRPGRAATRPRWSAGRWRCSASAA